MTSSVYRPSTGVRKKILVAGKEMEETSGRGRLTEEESLVDVSNRTTKSQRIQI